jgi:hypothetical protein
MSKRTDTILQGMENPGTAQKARISKTERRKTGNGRRNKTI